MPLVALRTPRATELAEVIKRMKRRGATRKEMAKEWREKKLYLAFHL